MKDIMQQNMDEYSQRQFLPTITNVKRVDLGNSVLVEAA